MRSLCNCINDDNENEEKEETIAEKIIHPAMKNYNLKS